MTYPDIALIGRMGSGKSAIAAELEALYGYTPHAWSDSVYAVAELAYGEIRKDQTYEVTHNAKHQRLSGREILQRLGTNGIRTQLDEDFWIKAGTRRLLTGKARLGWVHYVNDDTRFPNEADQLHKMGFILVKVLLDDETRITRLTQRDGRVPTATELDHSSERSIDALPTHITLWNTAPIEQTVRELMTQLANLKATA